MRIFAHLRASGVDTIELTQDYYWDLPEERLYDPMRDPDPAEFMLGQLSHDAERIQAIACGSAEPIGYAAVWLAALMRFVGQRHVG